MAAPCCSIACLVLGLAGLFLFCVGFALPYWFVDPDAARTSHGLWEKKECQVDVCRRTRIPFGVTAAFESCRVFSCATVVMAFLSFIFNLILVTRPSKPWAIRTTAVWICTVFFNVLVVVLFGVTEKDTLEALTLTGVDISTTISTRLEWGYWTAVGALAIFTLLAISCAIVACSPQVVDKNDSTTDENRHLTSINLYNPDNPATSGGENVSVVTTKTANAFPPSSVSQLAVHPAVHPAVHFGSNVVDGYTIQPSRAAVNIDHHRIQLNALDAPHHISSTTEPSGRLKQENERFVLNRPVYSPQTTDRNNYGTEIPFYQRSLAGQDGVYCINLSRNGFPTPDSARPREASPRDVNRPAISSLVIERPPMSAHDVNRPTTISGRMTEGPPAYTTLPRDDRQPTTIIPITSGSGYGTVNTSNQLYPNLS